MKDILQVRTFLHAEQQLVAAYPAIPEYQVFSTLLRLANSCQTVEEFVAVEAQPHWRGLQDSRAPLTSSNGPCCRGSASREGTARRSSAASWTWTRTSVEVLPRERGLQGSLRVNLLAS